MRLIHVAAFSALSLVSVSAFAQAPGTPASSPGAGDKDAARRHYDHCLELFNTEAYDSALAECEKANQLAPSYKILYNIGLIHRELNDFAQALKAFERYLSEGGTDIADPRRAEVEKYVSQLKGLVANLDVRVNVPGADVSVDDVPVGKAPVGRIRVNPGHRKVTATREGYAPVTKVVNIAVGENGDVELSLTNLGASAPKGALAPTPVEPTEPNPWVTRAWVGWGVTGALAIAAGITGFVALDKSNKLSDARNAPDPDPSKMDSQSKDVKTFSIASDVLLGATIVGAGVSTWLTVKAVTWKGEGAANKEAPSVSLGVTPFGVVTQGKF
ncbi:PEGA domain-containing protein [Pendulispora brunnea]|uniref:PEGA domain-containing protein n=1 Tax=Pendulispora brunnea TaxID=2905690 RepID=A0ABZ2KHY2_9BACT